MLDKGLIKILEHNLFLFMLILVSSAVHIIREPEPAFFLIKLGEGKGKCLSVNLFVPSSQFFRKERDQNIVEISGKKIFFSDEVIYWRQML